MGHVACMWKVKNRKSSQESLNARNASGTREQTGGMDL